MFEWEGVAGQPATKVATISYDYLAEFDVRQTDYAVDYIKAHANDEKPFFMDVNFMKMHNPTNASAKFAGRSRLGDYSDSVMELDDDIGRIMDAIRAEAPNTIVVLTADNGAWQDAYPDAGTTPFRGEKGTRLRGRLADTGPDVVARPHPGRRQLPRDDVAHRLLVDARRHDRAHASAARRLDRRRRQADLLRQHRQQRLRPRAGPAFGAPVMDLHRRRELHGSARGRGRRSGQSDLNIAWKYLWTAKDTWLGPEQNLGAIGSVYNLTMDPFEKYDMTFNGAMSSRMATSSPGKYAGQDNGWVLALIYPVLIEFDKSIIEYPSIKRFPGGASNDLRPDLQRPDNPVPFLDLRNPPRVKSGGG